MKKVLINLAHNDYAKSRANKALINAISNIKGVTINNLYEKYPDFKINITLEQKLAVENDVLIFQYPLHWYKAPSLLQEWEDMVFEYDFVCEPNGRALKGKYLLNVITVGVPEWCYQNNGLHQCKMKDLIAPFRAEANITGMKLLPPFSLYGVANMPDEALSFFSNCYKNIVSDIVDEKLNMEYAHSLNKTDLNLLTFAQKPLHEF